MVVSAKYSLNQQKASGIFGKAYARFRNTVASVNSQKDDSPKPHLQIPPPFTATS
jgi:hypothetical protein